MSWGIGYDEKWQRDIGYGVPAKCDRPRCDADIDRGFSYVCGGQPRGGEHGCGLYFCENHLTGSRPRGTDDWVQNCLRCRTYRKPYKPTADTDEWTNWKLTDESWAQWRAKNPDEVALLQSLAVQS